MHEDGQGGERDFAEAARWYRRAADRGNAAGQLSLARLYDRGQGIEADKIAAFRWYRLAASEEGVFRYPARTKAEKVGKALSEEEKARAEEWVRGWTAKGIWTRRY